MLPLASYERQQVQPNQTAQRLADLFDQNLSISERLEKTPGPSILASAQPNGDQIKYNISQHYHHSAHGPTRHSPQSHRDDSALNLLIQNDILPSSLLRSQLALFEKSNPEEQQKLIMLWRLAPPTYARNGGQELADRLGEYQSITLEQEVFFTSPIYVLFPLT